MGRHSLPDEPAQRSTGARTGARRRTLLLASGLLLAVAGGSVVALRGELLPFGKSCDGPSVRLGVAAAPDIAPALQAVARRAREDATRTDGRCLDVTVTPRASHEIADSFGQRPADPEFQVWIPDSRLWVDRVAAENGTPLTAAATIASSPVTLAAVPRAARALGWPKKTYDWAGLVQAATSGDGIRLGVADPARSATGLLALSRMDAAGTQGTKSGDEAGTRTAATAKLLHQRVADGDDQAVATLPRDGSGAEQGNPRRNQALLLSEQAAYAHHTRADDGPDLDLFYPSDGAAQLDYPYTLVDGEELTPEQTRAASRFMTLLVEAEGQHTLRAHGFRAGNGAAAPKVAEAAGGRAPQPYSAAPADPPTVKQLQALLGTWTVAVQAGPSPR
ncbi:substrate-binding domain-containing protein [Streptomyces lydicus]|uniref:substrate-binding domain-containing protein n=1 Tax=Streptomyces lydicus TaxID=47763 RepID=UPI0036FE0F63